MPLYEYQCESCANRFEKIQKFSDPLVDVCPACGGPVKKLFSSPAIQFKGSGFYINDYAKKSGDSGSSSSKTTTTPSSTSSDTSSSSTTAPSDSTPKKDSSA